MLKFSFRKDKHKEFKHIAHGLIPAASIAPKPAVPRTPPPRSPDPSPERPRSALAAAILSSSLTGQTWAIPPARPRSFSESGHSESFRSEPNISTAFYSRDRWSEALDSQQRLSSDFSEEELKDKEEEEEEEEEEELENADDKEEHVYQTLGSEKRFSVTGPVYAVPQKLKITAEQPTKMSDALFPSAETTVQCPEPSCDSTKKKALVRKTPGSRNEDVPSLLTIDHPNNASKCQTLEDPTGPSSEPSKASTELQREALESMSENNTSLADRQKLLEKRLQQLEQEISHSEAAPKLRSSSGIRAELQNLRQHAQELVDENDALKLTVHRLNVELSRYQTLFRPLSKQEVNMKYLSPLVLAYEDRMKEKDALLQTAEEQVKRLRVHVEEVITENERLHDKVAGLAGVNMKECHQLQQQAFLVLEENQILLEQLEAQHLKAKANHSRHQAEVSRVSKQLILLEAEKQQLQEDLEVSRGEVQKNMMEIQVLQARLKDAVTWDEHCSIAGKLRRQLEQQDSRSKSEVEELLLKVSRLQEESRSLALDKANLTADLKRMEADLKLTRQASRKAESKMSVLKQQKEDCAIKEEKTRHCLEAVFFVAEHISKERDQLLHMVSLLQQEKQGFISKMMNGTVRFGKLQEQVKVYRTQASTRLAALEEAAEGRTASYQKEILHLQRLLRERQEAEETLLQSKREVEEELEIVWQAATRENHQMKEALLNPRLSADLHNWAVSRGISPGPHQAADADSSVSVQNQPCCSGPVLFPSDQSPGLQRKSLFIFDLEHQSNAADEKQKHGLDFYC